MKNTRNRASLLKKVRMEANGNWPVTTGRGLKIFSSLPFWVDRRSGITLKEFKSVLKIIDFNPYFDDSVYDYCGNHFLTKDVKRHRKNVEDCCCGIVEEEIRLSNKKVFYFSFDYGH